MKTIESKILPWVLVLATVDAFSSTAIISSRAFPFIPIPPASIDHRSVMPLFASSSAASSTAMFSSIAANGDSTDKDKDKDTDTDQKMDVFRKYAQIFCNLFPVWTLMTAATALKRPYLYLGIPPNTFPAQIGLLMLCMGISLKPSDFQRVFQRPVAVLLAFIGCYGVMPALAMGIGTLMGLEPTLKAGLILVACINGAQASNLCTYIGQGDLALSVLMTTMTTIGAIVMTPLMGKLLLGQVVPVNAGAIALSTIQVVLTPIFLGMGVNWKFPRAVQRILPFSPIVGVIITCLLVGTSVAGCASSILTAGFPLQASAAMLHATGGLVGYLTTNPFYSERISRTFAIECAMKSSAFGFLLASLHFPDFAVRVPSAVSIVWMTLIGSTMAVVSRFLPPTDESEPSSSSSSSLLQATNGTSSTSAS